MRSIGNYQIIGPFTSTDSDYEQLVLDTNVLIDLRDFYFKGPAAAPSELRELLLTFPNRNRHAVDINYGWAAAEATWVRGCGHDLLRRRRLLHAADQVLSWDADRITREFDRRYPAADRDKTWPSRSPLPIATDTPDPRLFVLATYGSLLYLLQLEQQRARRRSKGALWALAEYMSWTTDVLGTRTSYALALAIALLAGDAATQQSARSIFKALGVGEFRAAGAEVLERGVGCVPGEPRRRAVLRPAAWGRSSSNRSRDPRRRSCTSSTGQRGSGDDRHRREHHAVDSDVEFTP